MRFGFTSQRNGRALVVGLAGLASATLLLSACTANGGATGSNTGPAGGSGTSAAPTSTPPEVTVAITPAAQDINPTTPIVVKARRGTLTTVAVSNASSGAEVKGSMSADNTTWTSSEPLGYGSTYKVDAKAKDANGRTLDKPGQITTLKPKAQANPNLVPGPGSVSSIGVGQPIDFQFTQPVKDKAAVQRKLSVKSDPPQEGGWYWVDSKNAHYRPKEYWKPGTKLTVSAKVYGLDMGNGVYGSEDRSVTYQVHDSLVAKADGKTEQMKIYDNHSLVKTMPISMGKGSTPTHLGAHVISFKSKNYVMDSCTYGVCSGPQHYRSNERYSNRISNDGEFVHENPDSVAAQGSSNVSHGCINLNESNAKWFYAHLGIGDVVEVTNSGGKELPLYDLWGDWSLSWSQWQKGSAL